MDEAKAKKPRKGDEPEAAPEVVEPVLMTFAEVAAWNRANAEKMPPPIKLPVKKRAKLKHL